MRLVQKSQQKFYMEKNHRANEREMNFKLFGGFHDTYKTLIEANAKTRLFTSFFLITRGWTKLN